jgi:hypothetical protein
VLVVIGGIVVLVVLIDARAVVFLSGGSEVAVMI